jgi:ribulose-phosphate 3-epimerase
MKVSASILDCDFLHLGRELRAVVLAGADSIHLDIMDGHFVPNITFGVPLARVVRSAVNVPVNTHLMVTEPERFVRMFSPWSDMLTIHLEASEAPGDCIETIRTAGKLAGISINPDTPLDNLLPVLPLVSDVLIMSVYPGFGGQSFIPETLGRVRRLRAMISSSNSPVTVSVDGGVTPDNCAELAAAGCDVAVAGSAIFRSRDYAAVVQALRGEPHQPIRRS